MQKIQETRVPFLGREDPLEEEKKKKTGPKSSQHLSAHRELCCLSMREVGDADPGTHSGWSLVLTAIISGLLKISCDIHTHTHTHICQTYIYIHMYIHTHMHTCVCVHAQSCPTLCDPMDYSLLGSSVHRILQARMLEWVAISSSRGSS